MFVGLAGKDMAVQIMGDTPPIQIVLQQIGTGFCNHDPPCLVSFSSEGQPPWAARDAGKVSSSAG